MRRNLHLIFKHVSFTTKTILKHFYAVAIAPRKSLIIDAFHKIKFNHYLEKNMGNEVTVMLYSSINLNILDYVKQSMTYGAPVSPKYKLIVIFDKTI